MVKSMTAPGAVRRVARALYHTYQVDSQDETKELSLEARLRGVRELMQKKGLAAYVVSSADAHQSEYVADCDQRRAYLCGFDGSAGTAVVTDEHAALWTDGRYHLQAEEQLNSEWTLMKQGVAGVDSVETWLSKQLQQRKEAKIGYDPWCTSVRDFARFVAHFDPSQLEAVDDNIVDAVWSPRPKRGSAPISSLAEKFSGQSTSEKIAKVRELCEKEGAEAVLFTALDEVAWLFNLRGADIPYNPVFFSYGLITQDEAILFVDHKQFAPNVSENLEASCVTVLPYEDVADRVAEFVDEMEGSEKIWIDVAKCCVKLQNLVPKRRRLQKESPISLLKGVKNEVEIEGMRECHVHDAVAMVEFLCWLEKQMEIGRPMTEISAATKLAELRSKGPHFMGLSFETISSSGPNGAVIHYAPTPATDRPLAKDELYLFDSGAQYLTGTTDVTRTVSFDQPSAFERECFTRVLQGHLALGRAVFPSTCVGPKLDVLARVPLWELGLDYQHGTGHGVGHYLNVHEGPHGINGHMYKTPMLSTPLQPGMMVTNEPGYYHDGHFGIRIENVMLVVRAPTQHKFQGTDYNTFESLTLVPYQKKMMDMSLMSRREIDQVDAYHRNVLEKLDGKLSMDAADRKSVV